MFKSRRDVDYRGVWIIVAVLLFLIGIALILEPSDAAAAEPIITVGQKGCYQWHMSESGSVLVIDTAKHLLNKRTSTPVNDHIGVNKHANDMGKSLYGKIVTPGGDIAIMAVSYKQIGITKFPFPSDWPEVRKQVFKVLDSTLCGAK